MKKFFINYSWAMWVGFWLAIFNVHVWDWRWWVFFVPLSLMIAINKHYDNDK